ncbi:MAG: hypothetical protein ACSLFQ_18045 [Thermoanaerobaculia bacterium]
MVKSSLLAVLLVVNLSGEERARDRERTVNELTRATEQAPLRIEELDALSPEAVQGPALGDQSRASLAGDEGGIVAVWSDARGVCAARIHAGGDLLDPVARVLGRGSEPRVAWNGETYLVVWFAVESNPRIEGVLLDSELRVLQHVAIAMEEVQYSWQARNLRVESNGSGFLVVRREAHGSDPEAIYLNIVSGEGVVAERRELATTVAVAIDVTSDGSDYYVSWTTEVERTVEVARARGTDGVRLWRKIITRSGITPTDVAIAWTGEVLNLVWIESTYVYGQGKLLAARTGTGLDGGVPLAPPLVLNDFYNAREPEIVSNQGGVEMVIWSGAASASQPTDLWAVFLNRGKPVAPPAPLSVAPFAQSDGRAIWDGSHFVITWRDGRLDEDKSHDLRYALVEHPSLAIDLDDRVLATTARSQTAAALAGGRSTFLALWEESTSDLDRKIVATLLDANGNPWKTFDVSPSGGDQTTASVSFRGGHYLVVWAEQTAIDRWAIFGRRFDEGGVAVDASPLEFDESCCRPDSTAVAARREHWLVLWLVQKGRYDELQAFGSFVADANPVPLSDGKPLSLSEHFDWQHQLAAASDGEGFLVAWQEGRSWAGCQVTCPPPHFAIRTLRVDGDGTVGQSVEVARGLQVSPSLAWNGSEYLLVWLDQRNTWTELTGARIRDGIAGPAFLVERGTTYQLRPRVVATVGAWLVVWETIAGYPEDCPDSCQWAAFGKLLPFDGGTPGEATRLFPEDSLQAYTAVAVLPNFSPMMILSRDIQDEPYGALRVFSGRLGDAVRRRPARR